MQLLYFAALAMAAGIYQITGVMRLQNLRSFLENGMVFAVTMLDNNDGTISSLNPCYPNYL